MSKRKHCDENIEECKRFRDEYTIDNSSSCHEKSHLLHTNHTLSNFVHKSVEIIISQRDEIEHLNLIIREMRASLAVAESSNVKNMVNMDIL
jgi:hypothetical protein